MSSVIGFLSLLTSLVLSLILVFFELFKKIEIKKILIISRFSTFFVLISFFSLIYAYVISDFSNYNVFQNSHSDKPLIYKIAGSWGNHEGSILLWICVISLYCFLFSFEKNLDKDFKRFTLMIQNILFSFFAIFVIFTSNPFLINSVDVDQGLGLNPILQDPALAIHPTLLYLG